MTDSRLHSVLFVGFTATLVALPLAFGSTRPMYAWPFQVALQLLSMGAAWLCFVRARTIPVRVRKAALPLGLLAMFLVMQILLTLALKRSIDLNASQYQLLQTWCLVQVFGLTLLLVDSRQRLKWLITALILSGTFQAVYGTLMTVTGTDYIWNQPKEAYQGVATGTFVNRNHLAGYLEMTLALGLGLLVANLESNQQRTWRQQLRSWINTLLGEKARVRICLALMVIGLILTQSRMGNTAFFASMAIAGGLGLFLFRRSSRGVIILFTSLLIIDIFLMGTFFGIDKLQSRIEKTDIETEQRLVVNRLSLQGVKDRPWIGTGLGTWYTSFPQYRNDVIYGQYRHAHSDLIQFPSELGVIGMLPLVLLVIHSLIHAIRVQVSRKSQFMRAMGFASTMGITAILIHSISDFNLQVFANASTFMVLLALPYLAGILDRQSSNRSLASSTHE
jgi:O-antigen ligase